ncbi:response regulator transcription factor [Propionibacteriaceae bacterium G1746]|uniref:response regulator transcription factor n=1 Tax=Aestuariimicrobium sp. G57 TaxID=3418485 RepID=UPI003C2A3E33
MSKIVVVEDSDVIRTAISSALRSQGHLVKALPDGTELEAVLVSGRPDVVILDVMLPGGRDGFELLKVVRRLSRTGVIMVTARDEVESRVRGLSEGADDYLPKPFSMSELIARVESLLRRVGDNGAEVTIGDLTVADGASLVQRSGVEISLTDTERKILAELARSPGRVVSKTHLLTAIWGYDGYDENIVEVHISSLRRRLEAAGPRVIHTVRGRGYKLESA